MVPIFCVQLGKINSVVKLKKKKSKDISQRKFPFYSTDFPNFRDFHEYGPHRFFYIVILHSINQWLVMVTGGGTQGGKNK